MTRIYSTPQAMYDKLNLEFSFVTDLCADESNAKCVSWLPRDLGLDWRGRGVGFLNPPFGREISHWLAKAVSTRRKIVAVVPGRTNPPWWHDYVMKAAEIRFVPRKVSFRSSDGHKGVPSWGVVVVVFRPGHRGLPFCTSWDWR